MTLAVCLGVSGLVALTLESSDGLVGLATGEPQSGGCAGTSAVVNGIEFPAVFDSLTGSDFRVEEDGVPAWLRSDVFLNAAMDYRFSDGGGLPQRDDPSTEAGLLAAVFDRAVDRQAVSNDPSGASLIPLERFQAFDNADWECFELATQAGGERICRAEADERLWAEMSFVSAGVRVAVADVEQGVYRLLFAASVRSDGQEFLVRLYPIAESRSGWVHGVAESTGWRWMGLEGNSHEGWRGWLRFLGSEGCDACESGVVSWQASELDAGTLPMTFDEEWPPSQTLTAMALALRQQTELVQLRLID
jgi:hypothetical protein